MQRNLSQKGVHLLEVIVASALFFLVSIFLLTLLPSSQWAGRKAENRLLAETYLDSEIENLRGKPFGELVDGPQPTYQVESRGVSYEVKTEIGTETGVDSAFVKRVEVTVTWQEGERTLRVQGRSLIGKLRS